MLPFTLTKEVKLTLLKYDCLGFDYAWQAAAAILTHFDWSTRWDFKEASECEIEVLETWKSHTLSRLN